MTWAQRLLRVFGIEINTCTRCGGQLKVMTSIEEPEVIARFLAHIQKAARINTKPSCRSARGRPPTGTVDLTPEGEILITCRKHPRRAWAGSCRNGLHSRGARGFGEGWGSPGKSGASNPQPRPVPAAYRKPRKGEFRQPSAASSAREGDLKVLSADQILVIGYHTVTSAM
jgi:hypothetical protein